MKKKLWMSMCLLACLMVTNTMYAQNNDYKNLVAKRLKAEMGVMASSSLNAMQRICLRKSVDAVKEKHPEMSETQRTILAAELVEKYSQEQVFVDMAEIVTPFYEKCQISIEELKAYEEVAGTERSDLPHRIRAGRMRCPWPSWPCPFPYRWRSGPYRECPFPPPSSKSPCPHGG